MPSSTTPEFTWPIFILGCVGALAPEIIRFYNLRHTTDFSWSWFYVIISLLFMPLGGVIAWILPATSYWGAFYIGVSTPVVITTIMKDRKHRGIRPDAKSRAEKLREAQAEKATAGGKKDGWNGGAISNVGLVGAAIAIGRASASLITDLRRNFFNGL